MSGRGLRYLLIGLLMTVGWPEGAAAVKPDGEELLGTPAPDWQVTGWLNSEPVTLQQLRGRVVLVRWWTGPECPYCAASAPSLNTWYEKYHDQGLAVVGLYHHKSPVPLTREHVLELVQRYAFQFPVAIDPNWQTLNRWWLDGHPHAWTSVSFLIDKKGIIRFIHPGGSYAPEEAEAVESMIRVLVAEGARPNRLIHEKSPYLLQHAYNPVDWYPWGEEAFAKAKRENKPVFLSVGYSTCYWCHVMEKESFENSEVAKLMNDIVVAIKVDREERPDIDAIYMNAVMAMTGQGGWPMTVFLTPEGKPFWGGTYFPPEDRWGRPGLKTVLRSISQAWKSRRQEVLRSSRSLTEAIQAGAAARSTAPLTKETLDAAVRAFAGQYDPVHGGFGPAPKFPRSHTVSFLVRSWSRTKDPKTLEMVEKTLDAMARGGIHDQVGGGFHRYSTDERCLVPHFEKMLYDQALLARAYLEAYQVTGKPQYAEVARDIFEYVLRDMREAHGAFHSAEDAGEVGHEGEFYVWTPAEIEQALGSEEGNLFSRFYGVTPGGNFERGASILNSSASMDLFAKQQGLSVEELRKRLNESRATLLAARNQREHPHRDDKILTDWNGLMIGALAYGARVLDEPRYAQAAEEAARFILDRLQRDGRLLHRYRDGEASIPAFLDDYAFLSWGLLDLYEATFEVRWLAESKRLTQTTLNLFWDERQGGFFLSGEHNERLVAQTKELYDGALPSGNSVAALNLARLGQLTMDKGFQIKAERMFGSFSAQVIQAAQAFPQFLIALDFWLGPSQEIVIAGDPGDPQTRRMIRAVHERFLPRAVLALHPEDASAAQVEALVPFLKAQRSLGGKPTAYVCRNYVCNLPTTDLVKMTSLLDESY